MTKLPTEITVTLDDKNYEKNEIDELYEEIAEWMSDYISNKTGFCHKGFGLEIKITANHIMWDTDED